MRFYLLTVESSSQSGTQLRLQPPVPIQNLSKNMLMPMAGDKLELCLPDGSVRDAIVGHLGIEFWSNGEGHLYTTSDPSNPVLTLTIAGGLHTEDVPPGTEIWLKEAKFQTPT